jgi:hypothetical protein
MGGSVNVVNPATDLTVRIFDSFYAYEQNVSSEEYDVVFSYLKSIFITATAAGNFAVSLFRIADETNVNVLTVLDSIQGQDALQLTQTLAYYLNNLRSGSTLLGFGAAVTPNYYTARNVLP